MRTKPRGTGDCCQSAILDKLKYVMSRIDSMVTAVRVNGTTKYPDGNGVVDLGTIEGGGDAVWGEITGTLADQTDLKDALDAKADSADLATVATTGDYDDLIDKPTIPAAQIQSDWTQADATALDYIKNKPTIPPALSAGSGISINSSNEIVNDAPALNMVSVSRLYSVVGGICYDSMSNRNMRTGEAAVFANPVEVSNHTPNKAVGTDASGRMVTKDVMTINGYSVLSNNSITVQTASIVEYLSGIDAQIVNHNSGMFGTNLSSVPTIRDTPITDPVVADPTSEPGSANLTVLGQGIKIWKTNTRKLCAIDSTADSSGLCLCTYNFKFVDNPSYTGTYTFKKMIALESQEPRTPISYQQPTKLIGSNTLPHFQ